MTTAAATPRKTSIVKHGVNLLVLGASFTVMSLVFWPMAVVLAVGLVGFMAINVHLLRRESRRFFAEAPTGEAALARGDLDAAHAFYFAWSERADRPIVTALSLYGLAWTKVRQGKLAEAIEVYEHDDDRYAGVLLAIQIDWIVAIDIALAYALRGDLETAETWMAEAERRGDERYRTTKAEKAALARAVIACRRGDPGAASVTLDHGWPQCEARLTGQTLRPLRVVRAFAVSSSDKRMAGVAEMMITASRPAWPGEYRFLEAEWPEMAAFLAAHDLSEKRSLLPAT